MGVYRTHVSRVYGGHVPSIGVDLGNRRKPRLGTGEKPAINQPLEQGSGARSISHLYSALLIVHGFHVHTIVQEVGAH